MERTKQTNLRPWGLLGPSWAVVGASWAILAGSWGVLGAPWSSPRPSRTPEDLPGTPRLPPGFPQDSPGPRRGAPGRPPRRPQDGLQILPKMLSGRSRNVGTPPGPLRRLIWESVWGRFAVDVGLVWGSNSGPPRSLRMLPGRPRSVVRRQHFPGGRFEVDLEPIWGRFWASWG